MEASSPEPQPSIELPAGAALGYDPTKPLMTFGDLLDSGLVGLWADRDDIGDSTEFAQTLGRGKRGKLDDEA